MIKGYILALALMPLAAQAGETVTSRPQPIPNNAYAQAWVTLSCTVTDDRTATGCVAVHPKEVSAEQVRKAIKSTESSTAPIRNAKPGDKIRLFVQVEA